MSKPKLLFKGPVLTSSGYGVHSRQLLRALLLSDAFDVSVIPIKWGETPFIYDGSDLIERVKMLAAKHESEKQAGVKYDVSIQCTIPNEFERLAAVNIGVTAGIETDHVSHEWLLKCNEQVDAVVVPSQHSFDVFVASKYEGSDGSKLLLQKPLALAHEGVDTAIFNTEPVDSSEFDDIVPEFNFVYVGLGLDKQPGEDRKNVSGLVKWFCEKFKGDKTVGLVLKTGIVNGSLMDFETTKSRITALKQQTGCGEFPSVKLIHGRLSDLQLAALYKHPKIKAFVSLTHGEGFGLPLLEAAACGLPVVATDWSGHLDFLTKNGKKLFVPVSAKQGPVPESGVWPGVIERGTNWAYPDENDAKTKMFKLSRSYDTPKRWATELAAHVAQNFSLQKTGEMFVEVVKQVCSETAVSKPQTVDAFIENIKKQVEMASDGTSGKKTLLYTMPMSAGDVLISTAVVDSLRKKFPDHHVFFATGQKFFPLLDGAVAADVVDTVIEWQPWMQDVGICEKIFDEVYTPNLAIQMVYSNWVHKGKGRLLADEMANHCHVTLGDYHVPTSPTRIPKSRDYIVVHPGSGTGQWEARNYLHWQEVISNLRRMLPKDWEIEQLGMKGDPVYKDCTSLFDTSYAEMASVIKGAKCLVGIDTVSMHMAAALGTPHVAIFGSSYSTSTGPVNFKTSLSVLIDTPSRYSCDKACYKHQCSVDKDHPCINEIQPRDIVSAVVSMTLEGKAKKEALMASYQEHHQKLSGYTHVLNAESQGFPYIESVESMLGFCDEVIVVDGGSTDGTKERLDALAKTNPKLQVVTRAWDWNEPGMDGMQKAFGRAMCTGEFLWQQDADEVVDERDFEKIKRLVKRFPKDMNLLSLPVIELWGNQQTCRTDRHSWKWRLSRNDFRITHGIVKHARVVDEKTGAVYAKPGMSDGCEYIDLVTHEYIPHKNFYTQELDMLRQTNPTEYGNRMNSIFEEMPTVWHYSWANLERKVRNFRDFWDKQWSVLHGETSRQPRFTEAQYADNEGTAKMLKERGGEHGRAPTFMLRLASPLNGANW